MVQLIENYNLGIKLQTGDIICRKGNGIWSDLFKDLSIRDKRFSHVGLIIVDDNHDISVIHAEANDFTGIGGVYEQSLADFMYEGDGIAIYRLAEDFQNSLPEQKILAAQIRKFLETPFDLQFDLSTNDRLYCSEFVFKVYSLLNPPINLYVSEKKGKQYVPVDSCNDPAFFVEIVSLDYVPISIVL